MVPVHKKGSENEIDNYRPISLLPIISKVLETVIKNQFVDFFNINNIIDKAQHGFQKNKSTTTALADVENQVLSAMDIGDSVIGLFCDLSKAFDCVHHETLLKKLEFYGVRGMALKWCKSYLLGRKQKVMVRHESKMGECTDHSSGWETITSGVPQGSVLGPLFFLIGINDIQKFMKHIKLTLFADDITAVIIQNCISCD